MVQPIRAIEYTSQYRGFFVKDFPALSLSRENLPLWLVKAGRYQFFSNRSDTSTLFTDIWHVFRYRCYHVIVNDFFDIVTQIDIQRNPNDILSNVWYWYWFFACTKDTLIPVVQINTISSKTPKIATPAPITEYCGVVAFHAHFNVLSGECSCSKWPEFWLNPN